MKGGESHEALHPRRLRDPAAGRDPGALRRVPGQRVDAVHQGPAGHGGDGAPAAGPPGRGDRADLGGPAAAPRRDHSGRTRAVPLSPPIDGCRAGHPRRGTTVCAGPRPERDLWPMDPGPMGLTAGPGQPGSSDHGTRRRDRQAEPGRRNRIGGARTARSTIIKMLSASPGPACRIHADGCRRTDSRRRCRGWPAPTRSVGRGTPPTLFPRLLRPPSSSGVRDDQPVATPGAAAGPGPHARGRGVRPRPPGPRAQRALPAEVGLGTGDPPGDAVGRGGLPRARPGAAEQHERRPGTTAAAGTAAGTGTPGPGPGPDVPEFEPWLSAFEVVDLARYYVAPELDADAVLRTLHTVGLYEQADRRVGGFSRGMTQRLGLAAALIGDPRLLLLDEPTSALDPAGRAEILDLVAAMRGHRTVIFSSHILGDVQRVADQVGVLRAGRLIYQGETRALVDEYLDPRWIVRLGSPAQDVVRELGTRSWARRVEQLDERRIRIDADTVAHGEQGIPEVLAACRARLISCEPLAADLEAAFLALTGGEVRRERVPAP